MDHNLSIAIPSRIGDRFEALEEHYYKVCFDDSSSSIQEQALHYQLYFLFALFGSGRRFCRPSVVVVGGGVAVVAPPLHESIPRSYVVQIWPMRLPTSTWQPPSRASRRSPSCLPLISGVCCCCCWWSRLSHERRTTPGRRPDPLGPIRRQDCADTCADYAYYGTQYGTEVSRNLSLKKSRAVVCMYRTRHHSRALACKDLSRKKQYKT